MKDTALADPLKRKELCIARLIASALLPRKILRGVVTVPPPTGSSKPVES
jgi:hypothetical protein